MRLTGERRWRLHRDDAALRALQTEEGMCDSSSAVRDARTTLWRRVRTPIGMCCARADYDEHRT
jgi:hypothetical protein